LLANGKALQFTNTHKLLHLAKYTFNIICLSTEMTTQRKCGLKTSSSNLLLFISRYHYCSAHLIVLLIHTATSPTKPPKHTCYTIQLVHYSHFNTHSLQHLKPIKC
jgi:hypothetical protein